MQQFESGWAVVTYAWLIGLTANLVFFYAVVPTAAKLWNFGLGKDKI